MDILLVALLKGNIPLAKFQFGVSIHALSILEQLDFQEATPIFPDGSPVDQETLQALSEDGVVIPRGVQIDTETFLSLIKMMDPHSVSALPDDVELVEKIERCGTAFTLMQKVMVAAVTAIKDEPDVAVTLALLPEAEQSSGEFDT